MDYKLDENTYRQINIFNDDIIIEEYAQGTNSYFLTNAEISRGWIYLFQSMLSAKS